MLVPACDSLIPPVSSTLPVAELTTKCPLVVGSRMTELTFAGATALTAISCSFSSLVVAGLTTTLVLVPTTVAEVVELVVEELLLPQAMMPSATAARTATSESRGRRVGTRGSPLVGAARASHESSVGWAIGEYTGAPGCAGWPPTG